MEQRSRTKGLLEEVALPYRSDRGLANLAEFGHPTIAC